MKRFILVVFLCILPVFVPAGVLAANTTTTTTVVTTYAAPSGPPTLTSVNPSGGDANTTVSIASLGTNFASAAGIRLKGSSGKDIVGSVTSVTSTAIVATFNLNNQDPGEYQVCVYNNASTYACGLAFTIKTAGDTATTGSVFFETSPTGATVLLNGTKIGTSVFTYSNATPGTYKVVIQKSGYEDYTDSITVREGKRVKFYARLTQLGARTAAATATLVQTATTIRKSTFQVPTTWPSDTPAAASPVDPAMVIGAVAIGLGIVAIRRR